MPALDPMGIVNDIKLAMTDVLEKDLATVRGFSERQLIMMAKQAVWITEASIAHEFDDDPALRDDFLDNLQMMAHDFSKTLRGLLAVTIEKILNAIIDILWGAIERAIGVSLPRPI